MTRTRFSPSPTGLLHLGNARTALFAALYAAHEKGVFILRIEDTDVVRSEQRYSDILQDDMHWLGINWQEGPGVDGAYGPYWQSQRQKIYDKYFHELEQKGLVYPCFCTEQELLLARKLQLARKQPPRYSGVCRGLSAEEVKQRIAQGIKPTMRFHVPEKTKIEYVDLVKGPQKFKSDDIGDFIIRRADGSAPFLFCNAIDDALMKVSIVIRGDDHVANTPRQIMLLQALNLPQPHYAHLSMITGEDGARLSKRHGSFSLGDLREQGYLPQAVMNYLARLGHIYEAQQLLDFAALGNDFHMEKLGRSPARFDQSQLLFWQKMAVQALTQDEFWRWVGEGVMRQVPEKKRDLFFEAVRANIEFPKEAAMWADIFFGHNPHWDQMELLNQQEELLILKNAGEQFFVEAEQAAESFGEDFAKFLTEMKQTLGLSGKKLYMPLRFALTGKLHGPELAHIAQLLGPHKVKERFSLALLYVSGKK